MKQPSLKTTLAVILVVACTASAAIAMGGARAANLGTSEAPAGVIGEVVAVTTEHRDHVLSVKTESGTIVSIVVDEATQVKRLPPGERSIENAEDIAAGDIAPGDLVYARGAHPDSSGTGRARQLIVLSRVEYGV